MSKLIILLIIIPNIVFAGSMKMIGEKGKESEVERIIKIEMYDNYFLPEKLNIKKGETIKFIVYNLGEFVHEFNIATKKMHIEHQKEMMNLVENEILLVNKIDRIKMKKLSKKDHSMNHSHSNSVLLEPNQTGEIIWKFNSDTKLEAACNVPGHYETGMVLSINNI